MSVNVAEIREKLLRDWGHLGVQHGDLGSIAIAQPPGSPHMHYFYPPPPLESLAGFELVLGRKIPAIYRGFLLQSNGATLFSNVELYGVMTLKEGELADENGQAMALEHGNVDERLKILTDEHFCIGEMVAYDTAARMYLTTAGKIELRANHSGRSNQPGDIAYEWPSFEGFFTEELNRLPDLFEKDGRLKQNIGGVLPGKAFDWDVEAAKHA